MYAIVYYREHFRLIRRKLKNYLHNRCEIIWFDYYYIANTFKIMSKKTFTLIIRYSSFTCIPFPKKNWKFHLLWEKNSVQFKMNGSYVEMKMKRKKKISISDYALYVYSILTMVNVLLYRFKWREKMYR